MTDQPKRSRWKRRALIAFVLLLAVQYVLSVGPAVWVQMTYTAGHSFAWEFLNGLYKPLHLVMERWPALKAFVNWYGQFWMP